MTLEAAQKPTDIPFAYDSLILRSSLASRSALSPAVRVVAGEMARFTYTAWSAADGLLVVHGSTARYYSTASASDGGPFELLMRAVGSQ